MASEALKRVQTVPTPKCQRKVIQDLNPRACHITPNMLSIHYVVDISQFAKFHKGWLVTV